MTIESLGLALHHSLAKRIDKSYSAIKRNKRLAQIAIQHTHPGRDLRDRDTYYQLLSELKLLPKLRGQTTSFTNLMVETLARIGYTSWAYSDSNYLMIDTEVHVDIGSVTFKIWSFNKPQFSVDIESDYYYNYPLASHPSSDLGRPIYGVQKLVNSLAIMAGIIHGYQQCFNCYYAPKYEYYCGLGLIPFGSCAHRRDGT